MTKKKNASQRWLDKKMESETFRDAYEGSSKEHIEFIKQDTVEDAKIIFKMLRKSINPVKMCDCCLNNWTNFTLQEEKLCDECYQDKYLNK